MSDRHGRFVWYELMTPNPARAARFYTTLVGWGAHEWGGGAPYTMWTNGGAPLGGIWPMPTELEVRGAVPQWLPYIGTRDVDVTVGEAVRLGGSVVRQPEDIPGTGRFAVLKDPQGAVFAIYRSVGGSGLASDAPSRPGEFSWHELTTTDHVAAFDFYSRLFGWQKTGALDMGPMGIYQMFGQGERVYGGMFDKTPGMPLPPNWLCYIQVEDVKRAAELVEREGGTVINEPMEVPNGYWIVQCVDPDGAAFALHELAGVA
jgi:predicted enzyme related to lactoylglutathione lyase